MSNTDLDYIEAELKAIDTHSANAYARLESMRTVTPPPVVVPPSPATPLPYGSKLYPLLTRPASTARVLSVTNPTELQNAFDSVAATGNVIIELAGGEYTGVTDYFLNKTFTAPILIRPKSGQRVHIVGGWNFSTLADKIIIDGGKLSDGRKGLYIGGKGTNLVRGIACIGSGAIDVWNTEIDGILGGAGFYFGGAGQYSKVGRDVNLLCSVIHHCGSRTAPPNSPTRADAPFGHDQNAYWGGTDRGYGTVRGMILCCVFHHAFDYNIAIHSEAKDSIIAHNTCVGHGSGDPYSDTAGGTSTQSGLQTSTNPGETSDRTVYANNISVDNPDYGFYAWLDPTNGNPVGMVEKNNLYGYNGKGAYGLSHDPGQASISRLSKLIDTDPLFVNATTYDYHLKSLSPAKGAGDPAYCPGFDHDGNPFVTADIGAFAVV